MRDGRRIIVTVLGAPTEAARDAAATSLLDWAFTQPLSVDRRSVGAPWPSRRRAPAHARLRRRHRRSGRRCRGRGRPTRLARSRNLWVVTASAAGRPHALPVWGVWDDDEPGFAWSCAPRSRKAANIAANPQVCVTPSTTPSSACRSRAGPRGSTDGAAIGRRGSSATSTKYAPMRRTSPPTSCARTLVFELVPERAFGDHRAGGRVRNPGHPLALRRPAPDGTSVVRAERAPERRTGRYGYGRRMAPRPRARGRAGELPPGMREQLDLPARRDVVVRAAAVPDRASSSSTRGSPTWRSSAPRSTSRRRTAPAPASGRGRSARRPTSRARTTSTSAWRSSTGWRSSTSVTPTARTARPRSATPTSASASTPGRRARHRAGRPRRRPLDHVAGGHRRRRRPRLRQRRHRPLRRPRRHRRHHRRQPGQPRHADAPADRVRRGARHALRAGRPARLLAAAGHVRVDARAGHDVAHDAGDLGARASRP